MYVTEHAAGRIGSRLLDREADEVRAKLDSTVGEDGVVAYVAARLSTPVLCEDGSNGDTIVVIAVDGSVETVMFRRSWNQTLAAHHFGARKLIDLTEGRVLYS